MATLKQQYETLDEVPEALREYYREKEDPEGKKTFFLDAEEPVALERAFRRQQEENKTVKTKLQAFEDAGVTVDSFTALSEQFAELQKVSKTDEEVEERMENFKVQVKKQTEKEISKANERSEALLSKLRKVLIRDAALRAITEASGKPKLLSPIVEGSLKLKETDGDFEAVVVDEKGNERIGDAYSNPMTITQFVEELRGDVDYASAFGGRGKEGLDTDPGKKKLGTTVEWKPGAAMDRLREHRMGQAEK